MTAELNRKVLGFRTAMSVVTSMLKEGVISDGDYADIEAELAAYFGLSLSTIFR